jgi:hypothetical protein
MTPDQMMVAARISTNEAVEALAKKKGYNDAMKDFKQEQENETREIAATIIADFARKEGESDWAWSKRIDEELTLQWIDATPEKMTRDHVHLAYNSALLAEYCQREKEGLVRQLQDTTEELEEKTESLNEETMQHEEEQEESKKLKVRLLKLREKCKNRNTSLCFLTYAVPVLVLCIIVAFHFRPEFIYQYLPVELAGDIVADLLLAAISTAFVLLVPMLLGKFDPKSLSKKTREPVIPTPIRSPVSKPNVASFTTPKKPVFSGTGNSSSRTKQPLSKGAATPDASSSFVGKKITIIGLNTKPELNGTAGFVTSYDSASGRYNVQLEKGGNAILVLAKNLRSLILRGAVQIQEQSSDCVKGGEANAFSTAASCSAASSRSTSSTSPSTAVPPTFEKERSAEFVYRIKHFYHKHKPEKLKEAGFVEGIATKYAGREQVLFDYLEKKYAATA